jgi:hypothetical protein
MRKQPSTARRWFMVLTLATGDLKRGLYAIAGQWARAALESNGGVLLRPSSNTSPIASWVYIPSEALQDGQWYVILHHVSKLQLSKISTHIKRIETLPC